MAKKKAEQNQAVAERTQQRLAARTEAAQRGAETRKRTRDQVTQVAEEPQVAAPVANEQTERPEANVAQEKPNMDGGAMVTVALRGAEAERLRRLAKEQEVSLSKLLVWMMDCFERNQE